MKLDIRVPVGLPVGETAAFIERCEEAGLSGVGVVDHQHSGRDVYITLALAAQRTRRMLLYPAVTNAITRHPMVIASMAHSLEELAPGRIILPVGTGFHSMRHMNHKPATVQQMRAVITAVRRLLAGESVYPGITEGKLVRTTTPPTPVYVVATGPRMVELAGEVGDGAFLMVGLHPGMVAKARELMAQGARRAGRDPDRIPVILACPLHFEDDPRAAHEWARGICFQWATDTNKSRWLKEAGIGCEGVREAGDLSEEQLGQICDAIGLFGPPDHCLERLRHLERDTGIGRVFVQPTVTYDMPAREVDTFQQALAARL